jgi:hypothetical protein
MRSIYWALLACAAAVATASSQSAEAPSKATEEAKVELDLGPQEKDASFLQASSKARFSAALTANAHAHAMWRFGGNFQPQVSQLALPALPLAHAAVCSTTVSGTTTVARGCLETTSVSSAKVSIGRVARPSYASPNCCSVLVRPLHAD